MSELPPGPPGPPETPPPGGDGAPFHGNEPPAGSPGGAVPAGGESSPPSGPGTIDLVFDAFSLGWKRTGDLLFRGPFANLRGWLGWGLVILLAGAVGGGGGLQGNIRSLRGYGRSWFPGGHAPDWLDPGSMKDLLSPSTPWQMALLVVAAVLVLLLVLAILWITSVFRYVLFEDIGNGEPAIREPFSRNVSRSQGYFAFRLLLAVLGLVVMALVLLAYGATILAFVFGEQPDPGAILRLLVLVIVVLVPLAVVAGIAKWFVHDIVIPVHLARDGSFGAAFREALVLAGQYPLAVLLFGFTRLVVAFAAAIVIFLAFCVTCCVWVPPLVVLAGILVVPTVLFWPLAVVTVPLMLVTWLGFKWLAATFIAPYPLFVRAWALAFVDGLRGSPSPGEESGSA